MAITSLRDNRKNEILPKNPYEVNLGSIVKPLNTINASNIYLTGKMDTRELIINGYIFNKDHLLIPENEQKTRYFGNVNACNLDVKNTITANSFEGSGNDLDLSNIKNSIYPGKHDIDIGDKFKRFNNIYANKVNAGNIEGTFQGDGSLLTNLPIDEPNFDNFQNDIIPNSDYAYNLGSELRRFRNVFAKNFISYGKVHSRQIRITNETFPEDIDNIISTANEYVRNLEYDITDDIIQKMGDIDLQLNTSIIGISYFVENIMKHAVIQDTIFPEKTRDGLIGSPSNIFKELHVVDPFIYGTLNTCNLRTDNIKANDIEASNFIGNGEYIDNITHFGKITSNIFPAYNGEIDIGNENQRFKEVFSDIINTKKVKIKGTNDLREDIKGILEIDNEMIYLKYSPIKLKKHTIESFTERVDINDGSLHVSQSGLYLFSLFGVTSNRSQSIDNEIVWYIYHYNRSTRRGQLHRIQGQTTVSIVLGKLDTIRFYVDPLKNIPLKFDSGLIIVVLDVTFPMLDEYFDL